MPKVSVIIPTFNRAPSLPRAIKSVLNQTFDDFELIIVDDGSTDNTKDIVSHFNDPRILYLWQENRERSAARNTGIKASQGIYITFLDSDDEYMESKLEAQVTLLEIKPEVGLVMSGWIETNGTGEVNSVHKPWINHPESEYELSEWLLSPPIHLCTTLIRRIWLDQVKGFDENITSSEDVDFFFRLIQRDCKTEWAKLLVLKHQPHLPDPLTYFRNYHYVLEKAFGDADTSFKLGISREQTIVNLRLVTAFHAYAQRQFLQAQNQIIEAAILDPKLLEIEDKRVIMAFAFNVWSLGIDDPVYFVNGVFDNLPEQYRWLEKKRRWILSRAWMSNAFRSHSLHARPKVRHAVRKAIEYDPMLIINRGILSILVKNIA